MKRILISLMLMSVMMLFSACGENAPQESSASQNPEQDTVYIPVDMNYDIFPQFLTDGEALLCAQPNSQGTDVTLSVVQQDFSYRYDGFCYEVYKYYPSDNLLYYFASLHAEDGVVYGDLYSLQHGTKKKLQTDIRMDSVSFAENIAGVLYIVNNASDDHALYYMAGGSAQRLAEQVYKAQYINHYNQVAFLRDLRGAEIIEQTIRVCDLGSEMNLYYGYELYFYDSVGKTERLGTSGDILYVDSEDSKLILLYGIQAIQEAVFSRFYADIGVFYTMERLEYRLENVVLPESIEEQGDYFMTVQENGLFSVKWVDRNGVLELAQDVVKAKSVSKALHVYACELSEAQEQLTVVFFGAKHIALDKEARFALSELRCIEHKEGIALYGAGSFQGENGLFLLYRSSINSNFEGTTIIEKVADSPQQIVEAENMLCYSVMDQYASGCDIYARGYTGQTRIASGAYIAQSAENHPAVRFQVNKDGSAALYFVQTQPGADSYTLCTSSGVRLVQNIAAGETVKYKDDFTEVSCYVYENGECRVGLYFNGTLFILQNKLLKILD